MIMRTTNDENDEQNQNLPGWIIIWLKLVGLR